MLQSVLSSAKLQVKVVPFEESSTLVTEKVILFPVVAELGDAEVGMGRAIQTSLTSTLA